MKKEEKNETKLISNSEEFYKLLESEEYFFVLFSNENCGYCKLAENNIHKVIDSFPEIQLYSLKLSDGAEVFNKFEIKSAPVSKLFIDGKAVYTGFGVRQPDDIYYQLKSFLKSGNSYFEDLAEK